MTMGVVQRGVAIVTAVAMAGCASPDMPNYQNTYQGYQVPAQLMDRIAAKFAENGLMGASVTRDSVGRVLLAGSYADEGAVERAFLIVQSIVGLKSTSPFYPPDVRVKQWETDAARAMAAFGVRRTASAAAAQKRALVIGINAYLDGRHMPPIQGEDDAHVVAERLRSRGYLVNALLGPQATRAGVLRAISEMATAVGPNDTLLIYVSSHGTPPVPAPSGGDDRRMSIVVYDSGDVGGHRSRDTTDYLLNLQATAVSDTLLQDLALRPTRVTRVVIDTCYSGEILRGIPDAGDSYSLRANGGRAERAGVAISSWSGPAFARKGIQIVDDAQAGASGASASARPPASVARTRSGYTIITATSEGEQSLGPPLAVGVFPSPLEPSRSLRGSFFTQSFFEFLDRHDGQVEAAFEDARRFTQEKAVAVSGGVARQVPREFSTMAPADNNLYR